MLGFIEAHPGRMPVSAERVRAGLHGEILFVEETFSILVRVNINPNVGRDHGNPMILHMIVCHKLFLLYLRYKQVKVGQRKLFF